MQKPPFGPGLDLVAFGARDRENNFSFRSNVRINPAFLSHQALVGRFWQRCSIIKWRFVWAADLELGDTADSEVCATTEKSELPKNAACHHTWFRYYIRLPSRRLAGIM